MGKLAAGTYRAGFALLCSPQSGTAGTLGSAWRCEPDLREMGIIARTRVRCEMLPAVWLPSHPGKSSALASQIACKVRLKPWVQSLSPKLSHPHPFLSQLHQGSSFLLHPYHPWAAFKRRQSGKLSLLETERLCKVR